MGTSCTKSKPTSNTSRNTKKPAQSFKGYIKPERYGPLTYEVYSYKWAGEGCKRCPVWRTKACLEVVREQREAFWARKQKSAVWHTIRHAVEQPSSAAAKTVLDSACLKLIDGTLLTLEGPTFKRYILPVFVVTEPESVGKSYSDPSSKAVEIKCRHQHHDDLVVQINTSQTGAELKAAVGSLTSRSIESIRLFFNGQELRNQDLLGKLRIDDGHVLQVLYRRVE